MARPLNNFGWIVLCLASLLHPGVSSSADADDGSERQLFAVLGVYEHYSDDEDFRGSNLVSAVEWYRPDNRYFGMSLFSNSFGQFSQFVYLGREYPLTRISPHARFKIAYGIVHGYRDEFEDQLALSFGRFAPGIIPSFGYRKGKVAVDLSLLSNEALLLTFGRYFDW
ncbi:MAG: hypothetical protein QNJ40_20280 [Xanthomonadales bacterium]|nr:hypothetical protein [Xanthomonadales bacterium]